MPLTRELAIDCKTCWLLVLCPVLVWSIDKSRFKFGWGCPCCSHYAHLKLPTDTTKEENKRDERNEHKRLHYFPNSKRERERPAEGENTNTNRYGERWLEGIEE